MKFLKCTFLPPSNDLPLNQVNLIKRPKAPKSKTGESGRTFCRFISSLGQVFDRAIHIWKKRVNYPFTPAQNRIHVPGPKGKRVNCAIYRCRCHLKCQLVSIDRKQSVKSSKRHFAKWPCGSSDFEFVQGKPRVLMMRVKESFMSLCPLFLKYKVRTVVCFSLSLSICPSKIHPGYLIIQNI